MKDTPKEQYEHWFRFAAKCSMVFCYGTAPFLFAFLYSIHLFDEKPKVFWWSFAALMVWCVIFIIATLLIRKKARRLERAAGIGVPNPIQSPVFKALYDEYRQNKLERLTKNDLFRNWKLDAINDAVDDNGNGTFFWTS